MHKVLAGIIALIAVALTGCGQDTQSSSSGGDSNQVAPPTTPPTTQQFEFKEAGEAIAYNGVELAVGEPYTSTVEETILESYGDERTSLPLTYTNNLDTPIEATRASLNFRSAEGDSITTHGLESGPILFEKMVYPGESLTVTETLDKQDSEIIVEWQPQDYFAGAWRLSP